MHILLVEPDVSLANTYRQVLTLDGHRVRVVTTAQAAIHAIDDSQPDLIILEIQLVSHSGIEFLYELRSYSEWRALPVMVLSFVPAAEFQGSGDLLQRELGVSEYHYKPHMRLAQLRQLVMRYQPVTI